MLNRKEKKSEATAPMIILNTYILDVWCQQNFNRAHVNVHVYSGQQYKPMNPCRIKYSAFVSFTQNTQTLLYKERIRAVLFMF